MWNFLHTLPSVKMWKIYSFFFTIFLDVLSIFEKKKYFSPWKVENTFHTNLIPLGGRTPQSPPLTKGKIFFAFLDVSDHLEAKKRKKEMWKITRFYPLPPVKMWKIPHFLFFFLNPSLREDEEYLTQIRPAGEFSL